VLPPTTTTRSWSLPLELTTRGVATQIHAARYWDVALAALDAVGACGHEALGLTV